MHRNQSSTEDGERGAEYKSLCERKLSRTVFVLAALALLPVLMAVPWGAAEKPLSKSAEAIKKAEALFEKQNWAEARVAYDEARDLESDWRSPRTRLAVEQAVYCSIKLQQWDDALERAEKFIEETKGFFEEAVGERFLGGLYMIVPHHGTKRGSTYLRGHYTQGVQVSSWRKDRREAIQHYERARELLLKLEADLTRDDGANAKKTMDLIRAERIGVDFDLVAALAKKYPYGYGQWGWIGWWWESELEAEEDSDVVGEADYEEPRWYWYNQDRTPPTGIPLGLDGKPKFITAPDDYSADLGAGSKIRFLLQEIQQLDTSEKKNAAAKALMRWAMIARSLYGPDTIGTWRSSRVRYDRFGQQIQVRDDADEPEKKTWELEDDEALTIVGGRLRLVTLPASDSPVAILNRLEEEYPESDLRPEAHYVRALYFQTRKQFPRAMEEYRDLIRRHPDHKRANDAKEQMKIIEQPDVMLGQSGVYLPDTRPKLSFNYRNTDTIDFKAFEVDLAKFVRDSMEDDSQPYWQYRNIQWQLFNNEKQPWKDYLGDEVAAWTEKVERPEENRAAEASTAAPLTEPGAYIVEAHTAGKEQPTRVLVLVTDIAIVQKNLVKKGLIYVCDARTGQPFADKVVRIYEHWTTYENSKSHTHWFSTVRTTNKDGVIEYARQKNNRNTQVDAVVLGEDNRMAFSFFQGWSESDPGHYWEQGPRYYVVTDRPVYRPGDTVNFRVWIRRLKDRQYKQVKEQPKTFGWLQSLKLGKFSPAQKDEDIRIEVYDSRNNEATKITVRTDEYGCATGKYELGDEPPLGIYHLRIHGYVPDSRRVAGALFRVEEYKKPEFEVTVKPAKTQARLGEKVKAKIEARYYFGAPVARGAVTYKVFRENYQHVYWGPGEYDWLYGKGYGRYYYAYPWLPWWGRWGCFICCDYWWPYWGFHKIGWYFPWGYYGDEDGMWQRRYESNTRNALRELVAQGKAELNEDGTYEIEIDTSRAKEELGDRDHRYTVEVEVRDESRRTIEGRGSVIVTRQEFYAFVETDGGWYRPGNETFVDVRTITADNVPVATKGEVIVYRIRYGGADNSEVNEDIVKRWPAETDTEGRLSFKYPIPGEGQYRIVFKTEDSWGEEVLGNAVFWVAGPKFDGRVYRFNDLEIVADKRTYKLGDTAHLLMNVAENNSRILFSDNVSRGTLLDYRFIDVPARSIVIDVPVEEKHIPNFFVEATLVRNGRVHMEKCELFVPPVKGLLNVAIETDKETYDPGETGTVRVKVTDQSGEPVAGQVTLTAYDESVTYIQDEFGPDPRVFYYGQKRYHTPFVDSSTKEAFSAWGSFTNPENMVYQGGEPEGWRGWWGLEGEGLTLSGAVMDGRDEAGGRGGGSFGYDGYSDRIAGNEMAASGPMDAAKPLSRAQSSLSSELKKKDSLSIRGDLGDVDEDGESNFRAASPEQPRETGALIEPEIRTNFSDTALWIGGLHVGANGTTETEITFPQSLTTWRVHGYALTNATQVGDGTAKAITTKNLLVRLQSPRFFIERDEVVLSANVHNYLETDKKVTAELIVPADLLEFLGDTDKTPVADKEGNIHLLAAASVKADGEHRFDWLVKAKQAGLARITVKALTDEESDGMRMAFPVLVHGINKTIAQSGSYRVDQGGERTLDVDLPEEIDPEQTRLEVTLSPSLGGVMIDALPYLVGYPYGCVEQTMSRFYPTVLVRGTLQKMGLDLEQVAKQRMQMNKGDLENRFGRYRSPVFDSKEMNRMVRKGLNRLYSFQQSDGGWGWWRDDESSPYQSAYVLQGLHAARQADVQIDGGVYDRGMQFLQNFTRRELGKPKNEQQIGSLQTQAYIAYILSFEKRMNQDDLKTWSDDLYSSRGMLNNYGRCLLALAMHNMERKDEAALLLRNVLQFVERDDSNETAWVRTPNQYWWFWWNNDIETNAWALKALVAIDPDNDDLARRIVKWLLNNRRNGYYWRSTRDTALVIAAMTDYMIVSGEADPDYALTVSIDGRPMKELEITKENMFAFDNRVALYGLHVKPGPHKITLAKKGEGALYYSAYLSYFTKEEDVTGAGNEIFVDREYFKLVPRTEEVRLADPGAAATLPAGQEKPPEATGRTELRAGYTRIPLKTGDAVKSGDKIEVVLKITAKNTYDYLAFEDMKPAGCEPVEVRSGARWAGGVCSHVEFRDEKVVFFIGLLEQGEHVLRYKLRAETPGKFHALPTTGFAMYAPEVRAISDEMRLGVDD